jgi:acyl carrier protein
MIPSTFIQLDELPLLPNGKVDRAALPHPTRSPVRVNGNFVAPRNPVEREIATICSQLLKVESLGIHDNFFLLGGHSLLSIQMISRIREAFGVELSLQSFFESPTVASLAGLVSQQSGRETAGRQAGESVSQSGPKLKNNLATFGLPEEELLENLNDLSDAEVSVLLKKVLSEESGIT